MKSGNIHTVDYSPSLLPDSNKDIRLYLHNELVKISSAIGLLSKGHLNMTHVEPIKPREGMIRLADGTDWNPGLGRGIYCYFSNVWVKLSP